VRRLIGRGSESKEVAKVFQKLLKNENCVVYVLNHLDFLSRGLPDFEHTFTVLQTLIKRKENQVQILTSGFVIPLLTGFLLEKGKEAILPIDVLFSRIETPPKPFLKQLNDNGFLYHYYDVAITTQDKGIIPSCLHLFVKLSEIMWLPCYALLDLAAIMRLPEIYAHALRLISQLSVFRECRPAISALNMDLTTHGCSERVAERRRAIQQNLADESP
jgi:hypothetical protein